MATDQLQELVALCWRDGHLYGARPSTASKTLTVRGKRRYRIRLQSDIAAMIMGQAQNVTPHYPDLWLDISDYVAELREVSA
jgi:Xaa-Pro aminopeptidase